MNEFIDKLIAKLEKESQVVSTPITEIECLKLSDAIGAVKRVVEEYGDGWIPCERELPPQPQPNLVFENKPLELYLVTIKNTEYPFRAFWNGKMFTDGFGKVDVIAWRELPKGYQPSGQI